MKPVQIVVSFVMKDLSHFVHLCGRKPELEGTFTHLKGAKCEGNVHETCANCSIFCDERLVTFCTLVWP